MSSEKVVQRTSLASPAVAPENTHGQWPYPGEPMPNSYGYARACSPRQRDDGLSLETQQEAVPKIAAEKFPDHEYQGTWCDAQSASVLPFPNRKMGRKLSCELLKRGDALIVIQGDRIFRSLRDHQCMERLFKALGVSLYLDDLGMDLASPTGEPVGNRKVSAAEYESSLISGRVIDAFDYLRGKAVWPCGLVPHGWRLTADRRLVPDEAYRAEIKRLREILELNGWTIMELAWWTGRQKIVNRKGQRWDERKFGRAFQAMRRDWPASTWTLGPEGHALPQGHPSLVRHPVAFSSAT